MIVVGDRQKAGWTEHLKKFNLENVFFYFFWSVKVVVAKAQEVEFKD